MNHSASDIVAQLLIDLDLCTDPKDDSNWPVSVDVLLDSPDNCIAINETPGVIQCWENPNGQAQETYGIVVTIRSSTYSAGRAKAGSLLEYLDPIHQSTVTLDETDYVVHSITRTTGVIPIGNEEGTERKMFTINALVNLGQTT